MKKKMLCVLLALGVVASMVACSGSTDSKAEKVDSVASENQEKESEEAGTTEPEENTEQSFVVGDVVETDTLRITYLSAEEYRYDNEYLQPEAGNVYYRAEFEFENIGNVDEFISSYSFTCYADTYEANEAFIGDDVLSATLSAGKKTKGYIYYEVPADAQSIIFEYENDFWTSNKIVFVGK